jgi:hypothetical protein
MSLSSHANVYNTCLLIIRQRGYALSASGEIEPDGSYPARPLWIAHKDGFRFCADNPIELLGLIGVHDHVCPAEDRPYWWQIDGPDLQTELLDAAFGGDETA